MSPSERRFDPSIGERLDRPPARLARMVSILIVVFAIVAFVWSYHSSVDIVISARGEIVPAGEVKLVQAAESGVVRAIRVRNGQRVKQGDILLEFDATAIVADRDRLAAERLRLRLTARRLKIEIGEAATFDQTADVPAEVIALEQRRLDADRAAFEDRLVQLRGNADRMEAGVQVSMRQFEELELRIAQAESRFRETRRHAEKGLVPRQDVIDAEYALASMRKELAVASERIREARGHLSSALDEIKAARSDRRSRLLAELASVERDLATLDKEIVKIDKVMGHQLVRAPVSGTVQELRIHTLGAVVERTDQLMSIVPDNVGVDLNLRIPNKDIGFVSEAQSVRVRLDAFEFTRYGTLEGELEWIGGDVVVHEEEGMVYPARVALAADHLPDDVGGRRARVLAGMQATADVIVGHRRLLEYFIEPLLRYRDESLRER